MGTTRLLLACFLIASPVRPSPTPEITKDLAVDFLTKYGYVDAGPGDAQELLSFDMDGEGKLSKALREVQRFGNIPLTGVLDKDTLQLMSSPRCGLPDVVSGGGVEVDGEKVATAGDEALGKGPFHHNHSSAHHHHAAGFHHNHHRRKRYILASPGWDKRNLKYHLVNWPGHISQGDVFYAMESALEAWGKHGGLRFSRASRPEDADITFGFYAGSHGDPYPFDGRGKVLAHAFFPGTSPLFEGDIHFDADEAWGVNLSPYDRGLTDLYTVTLHELGHALGLSHSPNEGSVMNPYYHGASRDLGYDDIQAMHVLYARRRLGDDSGLDSRPRTTHSPPWRRPLPPSTTAPTPEPRPGTTARTPEPRPGTTARTPDPSSGGTEQVTRRPRPQGGGSWSGPNDKDGCLGGFDVVAQIRNELFIIKDKNMWRLRGPGEVQPSYPVDFHMFFYQLPGSIHRIDAIYQREHDANIVIFTGEKYWVFDGNYMDSPRPITDFGLPPDITKVDAAASRNNTAIIFTGKKYWMYDDLERRPVPDSPQPITDWGLHSPIDAALTYDGKTYFFKNDNFWQYEDNSRSVRYHPSRKHASDYWLGC